MPSVYDNPPWWSERKSQQGAAKPQWKKLRLYSPGGTQGVGLALAAPEGLRLCPTHGRSNRCHHGSVMCGPHTTEQRCGTEILTRYSLPDYYKVKGVGRVEDMVGRGPGWPRNGFGMLALFNRWLLEETRDKRIDSRRIGRKVELRQKLPTTAYRARSKESAQGQRNKLP